MLNATGQHPFLVTTICYILQQSTIAAETAEIVHQRGETARADPTAPLCLGVARETDKPVTLSRTDLFTPLLITGQMGGGKTTLVKQIAYQQLTPESGLCYVTLHDHELTEVCQELPGQHDVETVTPDSRGETLVTTDLPADIGVIPALHGVQLGVEKESSTAFLSALIEQLLANLHRQKGREGPPYTLVLDGIEADIELDRLPLTRLLAATRDLRLHVVITVQALTDLSRPVQRRLKEHVQTIITGTVDHADTQQLAVLSPMPTADALTDLPDFHWWLHHPSTDERRTERMRTVPVTAHRGGERG